MKLLYANLADACALTDSTEAVGYAGTNVQQQFLSRTWRSTTDASDQWLRFDAGAAIGVDTVAIVGHNLPSGATITVQANSADSWGSPAFSQVAAWSAGPIVIALGSTQTYRYWRILLHNFSGAGYAEIARIFLSLAYVPPVAANAEFMDNVADTGVSQRSITGQKYTDRGVVSQLYSLSLGAVDDATRQQLKTIYKTVRQDKPVLLLVDEANTDKLLPLYCTFEGPFSFKALTSWKWQHGTVLVQEAL